MFFKALNGYLYPPNRVWDYFYYSLPISLAMNTLFPGEFGKPENLLFVYNLFVDCNCKVVFLFVIAKLVSPSGNIVNGFM